MTSDGNETDDSESSGDEIEMELLMPPPQMINDRKSRLSISAEAYGSFNKKKDHVPPVYHKSEEEKNKILWWLKDDFLFRNLGEKESSIIGDAFEKKTVNSGQAITTQGNSGSHLYVVRSGKYKCFKDGEFLRSYKEGEIFGELALIYGAKRAATINCD